MVKRAERRTRHTFEDGPAKIQRFLRRNNVGRVNDINLLPRVLSDVAAIQFGRVGTIERAAERIAQAGNKDLAQRVGVAVAVERIACVTHKHVRVAGG